MVAWLTAAAWKTEWRDAPTGAYADRLLAVAKADVLTYALGAGYTPPLEVDVPDRWVLAQSKQARALHENSLANADDGESLGIGEYQVSRRKATMSAEIRRLIIPLERKVRVG